MFKVCWFEFSNRLAVGIAWQPRKIYEKWDRVIVGSEDKIRLIRIGAKLLGEKELEFEDIFSDLETPEVPEVPKTPPVKPPVNPPTKKPKKKPKPEVEATDKASQTPAPQVEIKE